MKKTRKISTGLLGLLVTAGLSLSTAVPAQARDNNWQNNNWQGNGNNTWEWSYKRHENNGWQFKHHKNLWKDSRDIKSNRPVVKFRYDDNFFKKFNHQKKYDWMMQRPEWYHAKKIVLRDRDNKQNCINIANRNTGPFSVNRTTIDIDHETFNRVSNRIDIEQNIDIEVNTGNNTIIFNTVVGDITTGDVDIEIN